MSASLASLAGFTVTVALVSTALLAVPAIACGWGLARYRGPGKALIETLLALPLVLPPTAVGLLLLELFSTRHGLGRWLEAWGVQVLFTPAAVVLAAMVMSFPLWARAARAAFEGVDERLYGLARSLGRSPFQAFLRVIVPLSWRGLLAGGVLAFSRALGEFGATLLVAGNIPGYTQTLSLALFQEVQRGEDARAMQVAAVTLGLALVSLGLVEFLGRRRDARLSEGRRWLA